MNQREIVKEFLDYFKNIPEDQWCTQELDGPNNTHCALGHVLEADDISLCRKYNELRRLFRTIKVSRILDLSTLPTPATLPLINDYPTKEYPQPTPKQRIVAVTEDLYSRLEQEDAVKEVNEILSNPILETV